MVKIRQYPSSPAPSSVTGVPPQDQSSQIISQSVQNFAGTAADILIERQDKADNLAAMAKFGDADLAYETMKGQAQKTFQKNPKDYPKFVREEAMKLSEQFSENLSPRQASKFKTIMTNKLAQDASGLANWATTQDQANIIADGDKAHYALALKAEAVTTPEGLRDLLYGEKTGLDAVNEASGAFRDAASNFKLKDQTRKDIVRSSMTTAMLNDASMVHGDLVSRKYEGILTSAEEKQYLYQAKEMMVNQSILAQYKTLMASSVESSLMAQEILAGQASPADIARRLDWAKLNKDRKDANGQPLISEQAIRDYEEAYKMALGTMPLSGKMKTDAEAAFASNFKTKWETFWKQKPSLQAQDFDDVIGMSADLKQAFNEGVIDVERYNTLRKSMDAKVSTMISKKKVAQALTTSLEKAGKYPWNNPRDVYSEGYQIINKYIKDRSDLSPDEKVRFREEYLAAFTRDVDSLPEDIKSKIENPRQFALDRLNGAPGRPGVIDKLAVFVRPITKEVLRIGDVVEGANGLKQIFLGVDKEGNFIFETEVEKFKKQLER